MAQNVKYLNDQEFASTIAKGVTLVDFYADWCGPCRMIAPLIEEIADELQGVATIAKLDIEKSQETTAHYQVMSIPTLILFKDGQEVKRIVGTKRKEELLNMVKGAI